MPQRLVVFGLSLSSSWGNGHATTYRGLLSALHAHGWDITFFEWDTPWYRDQRDLPRADYCDLRFYEQWDSSARAEAEAALSGADAVLVGSYAGHAVEIIDWLVARPTASPALLYYDIDTPITLTALEEKGAAEYLRGDQIPAFDAYFSFSGGPALDVLRDTWGARNPVALYCGVAPEVHRPVDLDPRFECLLGYMGTYASDRQPKLEHLLIEPARALPDQRFLIAGPQYPAMDLPPNVAHIQHVGPPDHAAFYTSNLATLNVTRHAMVRFGWSPSVRLFEAAACGACIISDTWAGLETLFEPDAEILLADTTYEARAHLDRLAAEPAAARRIGAAARTRVLTEHTYDRRAALFERVVDDVLAGSRSTPAAVTSAS